MSKIDMSFDSGGSGDVHIERGTITNMQSVTFERPFNNIPEVYVRYKSGGNYSWVYMRKTSVPDEISTTGFKWGQFGTANVGSGSNLYDTSATFDWIAIEI